MMTRPTNSQLQRDRIGASCVQPRRLLGLIVVLSVFAAGTANTGAGQLGPPVSPKLEPDGGPSTTIYGVAHLVAMGTVEGLKSIGRFTKTLFGKGDSGIDPFGGLREGTTVVIRAVAAGEKLSDVERLDKDAGHTTEGMVTQVDRGRREITVRLDTKQTEVLRLANVVTKDREKVSEDARVIVYYREGAGTGEPIAHFFDKVQTR